MVKKVEREELEGNKVRLNVRIEKEAVNNALDRAYEKVVDEVDIPGFRQGKVPRKVLESKFGEEVLYKDALDILIPGQYSQAVEEAEIEPIDQPDIEDYHIAKDEEGSFTAEVEVKPEVELGEYTDFDIDMEEAEVTEEEVEKTLEQMQEQQSQLVSSDGTLVQEGDHVVIDFTGYIDGETFPGGQAEEYILEIGSGEFVPGFEEKLIGKEVDEDKVHEVNITFPEDYEAEDLAGEQAMFEVIIKEIKEKDVPELNDEFARESGDYETLSEMKEEIKNNLKEQKEQRSRAAAENEIIEKVTAESEVEVPEQLVDEELDRMFQQMIQNLQSQGVDVEEFFEYQDMNEDEWRQENREDARERAKQNLVLEAIAAAEEIEVSEDEIEDKIDEIAEQGEQEPEQVKQFLQMQGQLADLEQGLRMEKTIDFLLENN
ncbi:trigger factor [Halarsenatibacter silvermanii]|uniref:Trigger factor n=1 Tax=Halarsenatibacter silvermanii TaxID=321763 RepID=A0A1G9NJ75_9FIRM|nr:trigger factor [Halarsenatibacter silvermanii]SDL86638.1 trigger factor [Halarsenatibacter silvermanii]